MTGQKVWTTMAHQAKWCMLLARTDPNAAKHRGLTYFLMDMEQDGVEIRPLRQITGEAEFNELFIEEARIPDENIVGGENNGWSVAITTLMHERAGLAFALQVGVQIELRQLLERAREVGADKDPIMRQRFAQLYAEAQVLRLTAYRGLTKLQAHGAPGPEGSLGKWHWAEVNQSLTELALDLAGPRAQLVEDPGPTATCAPAPTRSRAGRPRSSRTSSPSACSGCRGPSELRPLRGPAGHQAHRARVPRRSLRLEEVRRLALEEERGFTDAQWDEIVQLGWPELPVAESGLGVVELAVVAEELGYACAPTPLSSTWAAALLLDAAGEAGRLSDGRRGTVAQWDEDTDGKPDRSSLGADLKRREDRRPRRRGGRRHRRHRGGRPALRRSTPRTRRSSRRRRSTPRGGSPPCGSTARPPRS